MRHIGDALNTSRAHRDGLQRHKGIASTICFIAPARCNRARFRCKRTGSSDDHLYEGKQPEHHCRGIPKTIAHRVTSLLWYESRRRSPLWRRDSSALPASSRDAYLMVLFADTRYPTAPRTMIPPTNNRTTSTETPRTYKVTS